MKARIKHKDGSWPALCILLKQSIPSQVPRTKSHKTLIVTICFTLLILSSVIFSGMRTDQVVRTPVKLIDSLADLLASNKTINFDSSAKLRETMKDSDPSSAMHQVYQKSERQSSASGLDSSYNVHEASHFFAAMDNVISGLSALVSMDLAVNILRAMHCLNRNSSVFYQSKSDFHNQLSGMFFNEHVSPEFRMRIEKT